VNSNYTIILGAEGKLGRAMAREVAGKDCNLILISISGTDLQKFAIGLQLSKNVDVQAYKLNLSKQQDICNLISELKEKFQIQALINNITCEWSDVRQDCVSLMTNVNFNTRFRASAMITWMLLPELKKWPVSYIQNVVPTPYGPNKGIIDNTDTISKMYAFSKELDEELKNSGVIVSVLHPSPVKTISDLQLADDYFNPMAAMVPRKIAEKAVNGMLSGARLIIPGFRNQVRFYLNKHTSFWFKHPLQTVIPREQDLLNDSKSSLQPTS
jgi:short-subunit dehydrogenase